VQSFLEGRIHFGDIVPTVERALGKAGAAPPRSIEEVITIDADTRRATSAMIEAAAAHA
jgi:1-deoxy-D-xylulose 5-phosphate reductoisomerase